MKTKEEILKMSKKEIENYKWSEDLYKPEKNNFCCFDCDNCLNCIYCSNCTDCYFCYICNNCDNCSNCVNCSNCSYCRNANNLKYAICNVEMSKEEYEAKLEELKQEK